MAEKAKEKQTEAAVQEAPEKSLLDRIMDEGRLARQENQKERAKDVIAEFARQIMEGSMTVSPDVEVMINARIAEIDRLITVQLNEVMHHPDFQKLEATWRGLHYLVDKSETGEMIKIRVLNIAKKDLLRNLETAVEFDQSSIFKKIYEEEFGTFGGNPYGALIGDYEFSNHPQDIALLEKMSGVAAAAHAPFIAAAGSEIFNLDSFTELGVPRDITKIFQSSDYIKWKSFRSSQDSIYTALVLPRILIRLPYGKDNVPVEAFNFEENVDGTDHKKYLWSNAAWAMGVRLTDAFAKHRWCAAIRGVEGGGLVEGLPTHTFRTDEGEVALKCPTEIAITDRREKELADCGFIPLVHCKDTDYAAFFSTQSCNKPGVFTSDSANANARLSSQIQYIMAVSRFAHYLKAMMRDKIGSFATRASIESFLNDWIYQYTVADDEASQDTKAQHPLREARIEVTEVPGKPGVYRAVCFLRPHFQLDELTLSLRLVSELPPPAQG